MKDLWLTLKAALRAALWKSTTAEPHVRLPVIFFWIAASMFAQAAQQYFSAGSAGVFSIYGINTIIAEAAVLAAVGVIFVSNNRTTSLAQLFSFFTLAEIVVIVFTRWPAPTVMSVLVILGLSYFSRNRTAAFSKLLALSMLTELAAIAVTQLPAFDRLGAVFGRSTSLYVAIMLMVAMIIWWTGAVAALFRGTLVPYKRPVLRAIGFVAVSVMASVASPSFPVFVGGNTDRSSYNVWELAYANFYQTGPEPENASSIDVGAIELAQPSLLEAEVARLKPEHKDKSDIYTIGIAGWADQNVFVKELDGGLAALDSAMGLDRGVIRLVNHADTVEKWPIATRTNFASAVHSIAKIMNKEEDVLLLFITSHGGPGGVALYFSDMTSAFLSPDNIATILEREGIKNRILIVSACYAGVFVPRLASPDSIILTAADDKNPSFGCSNERDWTYFGDALFNQNLGPGVSLDEAFTTAKEKISKWETRDGLPASNPQGYFGPSLSEKLRSTLRTTEYLATRK